MNAIREKLADWLESNPDGWLKQSFQAIGEEAGVSATSVDRYLPELIADREKILPSEVMRQRQKAGLSPSGRSKIDLNKVREVIKNNPDTPVRDLAYFAKCSPKKIQEVLKEMDQEDLSKENGNEISEIDAEMRKLSELRTKLLENK